jgi:hypothetical protein
MIASALRAEIERTTNTMRSSNPLFSSALDGTLPTRAPTAPRALAPLLDLLDRGARDRTVAHLAHRAFFLYLAAENGLPWMRMVEQCCGIPHETLAFLGEVQGECRDGVEEALDSLDALVGDPAQLPILRGQLSEVIGHFDRLCEEVARGRIDVHVSAA